MVRSVLDQSCRRRLHRHHADSQRSKRRFTPAEKAAMRAYALTPQKVNAYIAATNTLAAAKTSDRSVAQELEAIENEPNDTLAQLRAAITKHPRLLAHFQRQGLSVDDAILIPLVITFANAAAETNNSGPFAELVSPAQVNMLKADPSLAPRLAQAMEALEGDNDSQDPQDQEPAESDAK
jgi:hypothetical protein